MIFVGIAGLRHTTNKLVGALHGILEHPTTNNTPGNWLIDERHAQPLDNYASGVA